MQFMLDLHMDVTATRKSIRHCSCATLPCLVQRNYRSSRDDQFATYAGLVNQADSVEPNITGSSPRPKYR